MIRILAGKLKDMSSLHQIEGEEDYDKILVCNNSAWTIGEIARRVPEQARQYLNEIVESFAEILSVGVLEELSEKNKDLMAHFSKTVAITLGRLCLIDPQALSFCLPRIIKPWCIALRYISGSVEKAQAFRGLCSMIPFNPIGIADSFPYFCEALVEFTDPPPDLE